MEAQTQDAAHKTEALGFQSALTRPPCFQAQVEGPALQGEELPGISEACLGKSCLLNLTCTF